MRIYVSSNRTRVEALKLALDEVYQKSLDDWIEGFEADANPERELLMWETMALTYQAFSEGRVQSPAAKQAALGIILDCSLGRTEQYLLDNNLGDLCPPDIKDLVRHYHSSAESIYAISKLPGKESRIGLTEAQAISSARQHLLSMLDVRPCQHHPRGLYGFDPKDEYLFEVVRGDALGRVGGTDYLAVSKATGAVRHAGTVEE